MASRHPRRPTTRRLPRTCCRVAWTAHCAECRLGATIQLRASDPLGGVLVYRRLKDPGTSHDAYPTEARHFDPHPPIPSIPASSWHRGHTGNRCGSRTGLKRWPHPDPTVVDRPVVSLTMALSGLEGEGFPPPRLLRRRPGHPRLVRAHGPDGLGQLCPGRSEGWSPSAASVST